MHRKKNYFGDIGYCTGKVPIPLKEGMTAVEISSLIRMAGFNDSEYGWVRYLVLSRNSSRPSAVITTKNIIARGIFGEGGLKELSFTKENLN
jgi:hypothetical protein